MLHFQIDWHLHLIDLNLAALTLLDLCSLFLVRISLLKLILRLLIKLIELNRFFSLSLKSITSISKELFGPSHDFFIFVA